MSAPSTLATVVFIGAASLGLENDQTPPRADADPADIVAYAEETGVPVSDLLGTGQEETLPEEVVASDEIVAASQIIEPKVRIGAAREVLVPSDYDFD